MAGLKAQVRRIKQPRSKAKPKPWGYLTDYYVHRGVMIFFYYQAGLKKSHFRTAGKNFRSLAAAKRYIDKEIKNLYASNSSYLAQNNP